MKNKTLMWTLTCLLVVFFSGLSFAGGAPRCGDPKVTQMVIEIFKNNMKSQLGTMILFQIRQEASGNDKMPRPAPAGKRVPSTDAEIFSRVGEPTYNIMSLIISGEETYEDYREKNRGNAKISAKFEGMEQRIDSIPIKLSSMRADWKDDDIQKCVCSGYVTMPGANSKTVTYSAQFTDDGNIHVSLLSAR